MGNTNLIWMWERQDKIISTIESIQQWLHLQHLIARNKINTKLILLGQYKIKIQILLMKIIQIKFKII